MSLPVSTCSLKEMAAKAGAERERLGTSLGREPTLPELASSLQVEPTELAAAMESGAEVESLYKTIYPGDGHPIFLIEKLEDMKEEDVLLITADHGCDPATPSTDHSREYTPMLIYGNGVKSGVNLGTRSSFADISATVLEYFGVAQGGTKGESFLKEVLK